VPYPVKAGHDETLAILSVLLVPARVRETAGQSEPWLFGSAHTRRVMEDWDEHPWPIRNRRVVDFGPSEPP